MRPLPAGQGVFLGCRSSTAITMTVNLTGVGNAQTITVRLSNVTDSFSQILPDTNVSMNVLLGDVTDNKLVHALMFRRSNRNPVCL